MSTATRIIKNTGFLYIKMAISVFAVLYATRLVLASLGASDFGVFNIVGGAIAMLGFLNVTMASVTQRFMSFAEGKGNANEKRKVFNISFILHLIVALISMIVLLIAMIPLFNGILNILPARIFAAKIIYFSMVASTVFTIVNVPYDAVMNAHENMLYYSIIGILESCLKLLIAFITVYTVYDKLIIYGILMASIPLITLSIMKIYCHRKYEECEYSLLECWDWGLVKNMASFYSWNFLTAISWLLSSYGGGLVMNHFFGTVVNAAQGISNQVNGQLSSMSSNLIKAVNPVITKRAGSNNISSMNKITLAGSKYSTLLIVVFAVPFIVEMSFILKMWLRKVPEWTECFCCCQLVITIICQMAGSSATAIYAQGNIKWYTIYKSVMNISPVFVTFCAYAFGGAPYWFYVFMIAIWAIGGDVVIVYYGNKLCGLTYRSFFVEVVKPVTFVVVSMLIGGFLVRLFLEEGIFRLVFCICVTSLLFILSVWKVGMNLSERNSVVELCSNKWHMVLSRFKNDALS